MGSFIVEIGLEVEGAETEVGRCEKEGKESAWAREGVVSQVRHMRKKQGTLGGDKPANGSRIRIVMSS